MRITSTEFNDKLERQRLRIALIGMSNIGKSYTANRMVKSGDFVCYDVDHNIQQEMGNSSMDAPSMDEMAKWMGHPYSDGYADKAAAYLALETELSLAARDIAGNVVLDTTGSVVHLSDKTQATIKQSWLIVYIKASEVDIQTLLGRYYKFPKPTIWGAEFSALAGKTNQESLLASYPNLLNVRAKLYEGLADITIEAEKLTNPDLRDADILPLIRNHLA